MEVEKKSLKTKKDIIEKKVIPFLRKTQDFYKNYIFFDDNFDSISGDMVGGIRLRTPNAFSERQINSVILYQNTLCNETILVSILQQILFAENQNYIHKMAICNAMLHSAPLIFGRHNNQSFIMISQSDFDKSLESFPLLCEFLSKNNKELKIIVIPKLQNDTDSCYMNTYKILKHFDEKTINKLLKKYFNKENDMCIQYKKDVNRVISQYDKYLYDKNQSSVLLNIEAKKIDYKDLPESLLKYAQTSKVFNNTNLVGRGNYFKNKIQPYLLFSEKQNKLVNKKMFFSACMFLFKSLKNKLSTDLLKEWTDINTELSKIKREQEKQKYKETNKIINMLLSQPNIHTRRMCQNSPSHLSNFISGVKGL